MEKMNEFESLNKLIKIRDNLKNILKDKYLQTQEPFSSLIKIVMKANNINAISACAKLMVTELAKDDKVRMMLLCATLDLVEEEEKVKAQQMNLMNKSFINFLNFLAKTTRI